MFSIVERLHVDANVLLSLVISAPFSTKRIILGCPFIASLLCVSFVTKNNYYWLSFDSIMH